MKHASDASKVVRRNVRLCLTLVASALLCTATWAHTPSASYYRQAHAFTQHSLQQFRIGNHTAALSSLKSAESLIRARPKEFSTTERQRVAELIGHLNGDSTLHPAHSTAHMQGVVQRYQKALISLDPLQHAAPSQPPQFRSNDAAQHVFTSVWKVIPKPVFVKASVLSFGNDFRRGAQSPQDTLASEKYHLHTGEGANAMIGHFSGANSKLIDEWLATPIMNRVFVIGSRSDTDYVRRLKARYAEENIRLFFYQDCRPLCHESTVGAFYATSNSVISIDSPGSRSSAFVPLETQLSLEHSGNGRRLILLNAEEAKKVLSGGSGGAISAATLMCTAGASLSDDISCT